LPCCTEEEFDVYIWARKPDGSLDKEEPQKKHDHGMDTLRYGVMYEDKDMVDPAGVSPEQMKIEMDRARREVAGPSHYSINGLGGGRVRGSRWM